MGVAAAAGLSIYYVLNQYGASSKAVNSELAQDIKKIGIVQVNSDGVFPFQKFIEIFQVIRKYSKRQLEQTMKDIKTERRKLLE